MTVKLHLTGSLQVLASWRINDHEKGEGTAENYPGGPGQRPTLRDKVHPHGLKSCSVHQAPYSKHVRGPTGWCRGGMWPDELKMELFGKKGWVQTQAHGPDWSMGVETTSFGGAFLQRVHLPLHGTRWGWMGPCITRFWATTSFQ